ncbi:MAG: transcriptional regulator [Thermodesulfobacteriota bacterium]
MAEFKADNLSSTPRQKIVQLLQEAGRPLTSREICQNLGLNTKELLAHIQHIQKSQKKFQGKIEILPAECKKCGFGFPKRDRYSKPGKCPMCKSQHIEPPAFFWRQSQ